MGSRVALVCSLLLTGCALRVTQPGGALHVEKGEMRSVREEIDHGTVDLAWREVRGSDIVVDVVKSADALPAPLAVPHASGFTSLNLRFPYDGGGVGVALLANKTPLDVERAVVEAVWLPGAGFTWLYPVGRVRFEGPLSLQHWVDPVRNLPEDAAPYRNLIEDVTDRDFRFKLARGVGRVMSLEFGGDVPSTWELAAVRRDGKDVADWQDRARVAMTKGRIDQLEGCVAFVRENAWGARRGKHYYALPLLHVLLASEVEGTSGRWSWTGFVAITAERPRHDVPSLPTGLPTISLELATLQDRQYRTGPSPLTYGLLSAAGFVGALLIEYGLQWPGDSDGWAEWFDNWRRGGRGQAHNRRRSRAP